MRILNKYLNKKIIHLLMHMFILQFIQIIKYLDGMLLNYLNNLKIKQNLILNLVYFK